MGVSVEKLQRKAEGRKVLEKTPTLLRCVSFDPHKEKESELTVGSTV
jgi:hypothetical protein